MKAALSTEKRQIPGVHGFKTLNPNIKDTEWNVKIVESLTPWPSDFEVRRASVSSFGYGGTKYVSFSLPTIPLLQDHAPAQFRLWLLNFAWTLRAVLHCPRR